ncbi:major facilitator superfamily domain-containing protein 8 [Procambarus clarkii]|uniref:major facilitator superfamily domain-containing protein 8 n=1 Tax=Procambarus clarkii TaxID=6728 RepID=UPI001E670E8D|nr:major facilitator superfamily domain-containing protein 8-like [Procambarus clarkii]XP_045619665.1 major facilitator superfamily domain-containing protein 8-like [Procambarus clarkii]
MGGMLGKQGSLVIDHSMDEVQLHNMGRGSLKRGSVSTITTTTGDDPPPYESVLNGQVETPEERKARKRSLWIVYSLASVITIGAAANLGTWPYLHEELVPSLEKESLGFVVAANPLGQIIAGPLLGIWTNKTGSIRAASISTVFLFIAGNILYTLLAAFKTVGLMAPYYAMIASRFITGFSAAIGTMCRSYVASATTVEERTLGLTLLSMGQAIGMIIGPVIQALITVALPENVDTAVDWFKWNKYTATSVFAAALGVVNLLLLLPCVFQEYNISKQERAKMTTSTHTNEVFKLPKPDYWAMGGIFYARFSVVFIIVFLETLSVPLVMDQYAWTENKAMIVVAIAVSAAGILNIGMYAVSGVLTKKSDERLVMLLAGMLPIVIGMFLFIPWGHNTIPMQHCDMNETTTMASTTETTYEAIRWPVMSHLEMGMPSEDDDDCHEGCPVIQHWCTYTPQLPQIQLLLGFIIAIMGFPLAQVIMLGIFSKMLGPKPQGVWMGVISGSSSSARIIGPVIISYVYSELGTRWCFGILTVVTGSALLEMTYFYRRLVPMKVPNQQGNYAYDGPAAQDHKA